MLLRVRRFTHGCCCAERRQSRAAKRCVASIATSCCKTPSITASRSTPVRSNRGMRRWPSLSSLYARGGCSLAQARNNARSSMARPHASGAKAIQKGPRPLSFQTQKEMPMPAPACAKAMKL